MPLLALMDLLVRLDLGLISTGALLLLRFLSIRAAAAASALLGVLLTAAGWGEGGRD